MLCGMQGVLLIDKPKGWTSFDVVNYTRKAVAHAEGKRPKQCKVGHTGTLDPMATGLLVVLVGKEYTRQAASLMKLDKTYELTMCLGARSTTGDAEGELTAVSTRVPTLSEIAVALEKHTGVLQQVPPAFSAIKIGGRRAYDLARAGKPVVLAPRSVTVHRLELISYAYPHVQCVAEVSSGTYIRSLAEDIGAALGTGAYLTALRRTRVGQFLLTDAAQLEQADLLSYVNERGKLSYPLC